MNLNYFEESNDAILLQQAQSGNAKAFEGLIEKYWQRGYSDTYKKLKYRNQSKDILQEIFTHKCIKRETLLIEHLPAYLCVAVHNKVCKVVAKQKTTCPYFDHLQVKPVTSFQADAQLLWREFLVSSENIPIEHVQKVLQ
ncbi:MAG: hypothetical protein WKF70_10300 [Chitinophagaceae bacterium]